MSKHLKVSKENWEIAQKLKLEWEKKSMDAVQSELYRKAKIKG